MDPGTYAAPTRVLLTVITRAQGQRTVDDRECVRLLCDFYVLRQAEQQPSSPHADDAHRAAYSERSRRAQVSTFRLDELLLSY